MLNEPSPPILDRRAFLQLCSALPFVQPRDLARLVPAGDDRVLLVLELVGGNDGLNTVIPVDDARYAAARPTLAAVRRGAHALGDGTALHPALGRLHRRVQDGQGAVLHGCGYPAPDRSHFRSRDIWHTAAPLLPRVDARTTGWLGRAAEQLAAATAGPPAVAVGGLEVPLLLRSERVAAPSVRRVEDFQWLSPATAAPIEAAAPVRRLVDGSGTRGGAVRDFVAATAQQAAALADQLTQALRGYRPRADHPATALGRDLQLAAQLTVAGFGTRLVHASLGGFDTHARQLATHAALLAQLDAALDAFLQDVAAHGAGDRLVVLVHSEFGRRVAENASQGTDHGAAAPVLVFGAVRGGVHGPVPDLQRLDDGDLVATTDFRCVYADLLQWLGVDAAAVLGGAFAPAGVAAPR
ncbi:MAG: DUF1501 domain-containing protein [Planctomycetes bacterium]|nr:DUF1501 domain-containing protein [Planctomycetota bacterium]